VFWFGSYFFSKFNETEITNKPKEIEFKGKIFDFTSGAKHILIITSYKKKKKKKKKKLNKN
jgi:hypothetical protein